MIDNVTKHTEEIKNQIDECQVKIAAEKESRVSLDGEREKMLKEYADLLKENQELKNKMKMYEKCDPKRMEELSQKKKISQ